MLQGKLEAEERSHLVAAGKALKDELASLEAALEAAENLLQVEAQKLPNLTHPDSPVGGEEVAAELRVVGTPRCALRCRR